MAYEEAESKLPASAGGISTGQRVLSETFCINRLKEIRLLAGNVKLIIARSLKSSDDFYGKIPLAIPLTFVFQRQS
jgi:hypothetical protein